MRNRKTQSSLNFDKDNFTNYAFEEFKSIEECFKETAYSYHCFTLVKCGFSTKYYLLRISDIEAVDEETFIFVCPAYKLSDSEIDMAKRKSVLTEPNKLGLTPGKLSIDLPELTTKLDHTNSIYDPRKKKRVPITEFQEEKKKEKREPVEKKGKIEDEMINNTDVKVEGKLHSSHFLPPFICTRLWVLNRGVKVGWGWFIREVEGAKRKNEYYCRPIELTENDLQYERGGTFFTFAYMKNEFMELDREELYQDKFISLSKEITERQIESIQVVIDAMLCKTNT